MEPPDLPEVPMELHRQNRSKLVAAMRQHLQAHGLPVHGVVFLQGGKEETRYCTDHLILFRQESYFAYLFGVREPDFYGAIDLATGKAFLFCPRLSEEYAIWMGKIPPLSDLKERYEVDEVYYTDEMEGILRSLVTVNENVVLYLLHGLNTDSNKFSQPATFEEMKNFKTNLDILHPILTECRVIKTNLELDLLRYVCEVSSAGHVEVMRKTRVGMKEYQLESTFLHYVYMYGGCRHCSYTCICATGENSSVLHYGHAGAPNDKILKDGDMALLDMGAEFHFYGSDITCSFPVNGRFTEDQKVVYNAVLGAHNAVISAMKPGVCWVDMHKLAEKIILQNLKDANILLGSVDEMMEKRLGAVFMPHGLGHFLGLDTHDPGGYAEGLERPKEPGLKSLRTVRVLHEGMVITVEPGCYFIDATLTPALENLDISYFINKDSIARFKDFGGVRIESDVIVTAEGCENITKVPREIEEIEAVMSGEPWPLKKVPYVVANGCENPTNCC
uniref:Xaa-Pro dipeptidase n=1 Tax=Araucaria cunninghamii TaxID=56994 RepID=A0A0D6QZJ9_ARACU